MYICQQYKKMAKTCLFGLLLCCVVSYADENDTSNASSSGITQLPMIKVIGHEATGGGGEPAVISNDYIKTAPSATNTVTDLLRGKSYIQYDQTSRSSATGGEIAPPKISINGGKHYENSFLINGVSNNNNIYPSGLPLNYASAQSGQPTGETQTIFLDTALIDTVAVYTENVGAEYGGFTGGVIDAKIRDASTDRWHIFANYQYTSDKWTKFHWTPEQENALNTTSSAELQPKFTKYEYTFSADGPITDNLGLMLSYGKKESKIPLWSTYIANGAYEQRDTTRKNENFLAKLNTNGLDDFKASFTAIYAPYEHTLFQPLYKDSDFDMVSGGYTLMYEMENDISFGKLKNSINYQKNEVSRDSDKDFINQWNTAYPSGGYINWGLGSTAYEGAFGDYTQEKQGIGYKGILELDEIQSGALEHKIKTGIEAEYNKLDAVRGQYTIFYSGVGDQSVTGSKEDGILEGSQYSIRKRVGVHQERDKDYGSGALFLEDTIKIDRFTVRPGLRISTDSITDDIDIAWRFFANADIFNDDMLNVYGGYNRYYGTQILAYAAHMPIKLSEFRRVNATSPWVDYPITSDNPQHNLGDLQTPYSDELNIGATLDIYDTYFEVKFVDKQYRKQIKSIRPINSTNTYKEFANSGKSSYWGLTLEASKDYDLGMAGRHSSDFSITRQNTKSNGFDPVGEFDFDDVAGTVSMTHITYNGNLVPIGDVRNSADFNRPWIIAYTHEAHFKYFDLGGVFRYQSGSKGLIRLSALGGPDPDGIRTVAFEDINYSDTFNIDLFAAANLKIKGNKFTVGVDILNLLNKKNDSSAYYGVLVSRGNTGNSLGRQFFANFRYEF